MAQRTFVTLVCDLHEDETEGTETVSFAIDGSAYEIDVCDEHAAEVRDAFATYAGHARRGGRAATAGSGRGRRGRSRGNGSSSIDPAAVRAWARSAGVKVSERGRISSSVIEQFHAAGH